MNEFNQIEKKWQKYWEDNKCFEAINGSEKKPYYILVEFPYPSGSGLHVGDVRSYTAQDAKARMKRMQGFNVLYPMGWDAFGAPAEQFAIKNHIHPKEAVKEKVAEVKETTKAAKAETAEKAEPKKTPGRKAAVKEEFVLEFAGKQITQEEIKKKVKENWTKVQKNKIKDIKTIKVFLQPENSCAYYTINDEGNDSYKIEL